MPSALQHPEPTPDDAELVARARSGEMAAFTQLVVLHHGMVRGYCAVRLGTIDEADDLAQEVFVVAFRRLRDFDPTRPFTPWLRGIAANLVRGFQRKFRATAIGGNEELQNLIDDRVAAEIPEGRESGTLEALRDCLQNLAEPQRQLVMRRYGDGESVRDLTRDLGRQHSAVTMQLHRIRVALANCIQSKLSPA